jgi:hypothetical protein
MKFINCTPHEIVLNSGEIFEPSGSIPRVSSSYSEFKNGICRQVFGEVEGLPEEKEGVVLIVSAMVLSASSRKDLVAPATGHPDTIRNEKGHIVSVPGFVR